MKVTTKCGVKFIEIVEELVKVSFGQSPPSMVDWMMAHCTCEECKAALKPKSVESESAESTT